MLLLISAPGLTEAAALVNMPAPERPRGGGTGFDGGHSAKKKEKKKREIHKHLPDSKCHALETAHDNPTSSPARRSRRALLSARRAWTRCSTGDSCGMRVTIFGHFKYRGDAYREWKRWLPSCHVVLVW